MQRLRLRLAQWEQLHFFMSDDPEKALQNTDLKAILSAYLLESAQSSAFSIQHPDGEGPLILNLAPLLQEFAPKAWVQPRARLLAIARYWDRAGHFQYLDASVSDALLELLRQWVVEAKGQSTCGFEALRPIFDPDMDLNGAMALINDDLADEGN